MQTVKPPLNDHSFELDEWMVEPRQNRISCGAVSIHLEPRAMDLLVCLAAGKGQVVSRRELIDRVWATEFISDTTLTHTIADLRRALGDDPKFPRFIETIPKRGYRLVASVAGGEVERDEENDDPSSGTRPLAVIMGDRALLASRASGAASERFFVVGDQEIPLVDRVVVFGRNTDADIQVLAPEISRRHARLLIETDRSVIEDLGSKNGTTLNGQELTDAHELAPGDVIGFGAARLTYCHVTDDPTRTRND